MVSLYKVHLLLFYIKFEGKTLHSRLVKQKTNQIPVLLIPVLGGGYYSEQSYYSLYYFKDFSANHFKFVSEDTDYRTFRVALFVIHIEVPKKKFL